MDKKLEPNYDEIPDGEPNNRFPEGDEYLREEFAGAIARLLVERAISRYEGIDRAGIEAMGRSTRDLRQYRTELGRALFAIIAEGPRGNEHSVRAGAVAYLGGLEFSEATGVLVGLATSGIEHVEVRAHACEALKRIGGAEARAGLKEALLDPEPVVRERAVRALGEIAEGEDAHRLADLVWSDPSRHVRECAREIVARLLPDLELPAEPAEPKSGGPRPTVAVDGIKRPVGRGVTGSDLPQTIEEGDGGQGQASGGRDVVSEELDRSLRAARGPSPRIGCAVQPEGGVGGATRLSLVGHELDKTIVPPLDPGASAFYRLSDRSAIVDVPSESLRPGRPIPVPAANLEAARRLPTWTPDSPGSLGPIEVELDRSGVTADEKFGVRVRFPATEETGARLLKLMVKPPRGSAWEAIFLVSEEERRAGEKTIDGIALGAIGEAHFVATLYTDFGAAVIGKIIDVIFSPQPISMSVVPQTRGSNGRGPAHYNSFDGRFYCYAKIVVTNRTSGPVTLEPALRCHVTNGGNPLDSFIFPIWGNTTVAPNSSLYFNVFTSYNPGSPVHNVFEGYGDVRIRFTFQSTAGDLSDSDIWAAMAQVKLALNFVGAITGQTRNRVQSVVENEASAILEQEGLYISETSVWVIPSTDPDYERYRDIRMDDNKDHDCTVGSDEADALRLGWNSPTPWLDVWIVETFSGPACSATVNGFSPRPGPMEKDDVNSGYMIKLAGKDLTVEEGRNRFGRTIAHELGHYLGLEHFPDEGNFMFEKNTETNTDTTHGQFLEMAEHGYVERFVP